MILNYKITMRNNIKEYSDILKKFPKKRIVLSEEYLRIYNEHYKSNRGGEGFANKIAQKMELWMHKKVSKRKGEDILELGAGNLNHIKYENSFKNYDIVEPFKELYKNNNELLKVRKEFNSIFDVQNKYDKIVSIATLEHLLNLPKEITYCKNLLKKKGILQIAVPCEGELAFKLGWLFTTAISFKLKYNLDYSKMIKYEHVNSLHEILIILQNNFKIINFSRSPFILPIKNLSFYAYIECENI